MPLVALHNMTAEKLGHVAAWGALAVPSLAVLEAGSRFGAYGEITLVAPPGLADPEADRRVTLWDRDVYTPAVDGWSPHASLGEAVRHLLSVPEIASPRCGEPFNIGRLRTASARRFSSLEEAAGATDLLVERAVWDERMIALCGPVAEAYSALHDYRRPDPPEAWPGQLLWMSEDRMLRAMAALALGEGTMRECLAEYGFARVPASLAARVGTLGNEIASVPSPYFEAKVGRAVGLGEFVAAVVPRDAPEGVQAALRASGVGTVVTYGEGGRAAAVAEAAEMSDAVHADTAQPSP